MEVHQQNALFQYFADTLTAVVQNAKKNGRYDMGILGEWGHFHALCVLVHRISPLTHLVSFWRSGFWRWEGEEEWCKEVSDSRILHLWPCRAIHSKSGKCMLLTSPHTWTVFQSLCLLQISVERGMSWEEATKIWAELTGPDDGFYLSLQVRIGISSVLSGINMLLLVFLLIFVASSFLSLWDKSHYVALTCPVKKTLSIRLALNSQITVHLPLECTIMPGSP